MLQLALQSPNLAPHALERYSRAAAALCGWVRAVDWCACCAAALAPTRAALPDTYADQATPYPLLCPRHPPTTLPYPLFAPPPPLSTLSRRVA